MIELHSQFLRNRQAQLACEDQQVVKWVIVNPV